MKITEYNKTETISHLSCFCDDENGLYIKDGKQLFYEDGDLRWKIDEYGSKVWYLNGEYHREDGPAIERADGTKHWYLNGKRHREDGPAVEWADGTKYWYLNGKYLTEKEFNRKVVGRAKYQ